MSENEYRPIRDCALIGDAHTAALVSSDGSVDWLCWPRFDSPAVFCRLLDRRKGGHFRVGPASGHAASERSYVEGTNVLATVFSTDAGRFRLTDLMPVERLNRAHEGEDIGSHYRVIRLVEGFSGEAEVEVSFRPTFDYARAEASFRRFDGGIVASHGREALVLSCPSDFREDPSGGLSARFKIEQGRRVWVALTYRERDDPAASATPEFDADTEFGADARLLARLGNYPQGFTHLGLIRSALHIAKAEALGPEEHAENQVERADKMEKAGQVSGGPPR